jgi:membrane-associated phospholipid phosphatase
VTLVLPKIHLECGDHGVRNGVPVRHLQRRRKASAGGLVLILLLLAGSAAGQSTEENRPCTDKRSTLPCSSTRPDNTLKGLAKRLPADQWLLWTAPTRIQIKHLKFGIPLAGLTTVALASDVAAARNVPTNPTFVNRARRGSDEGLALTAGTAGGLYIFGKLKRNDHAAEAGLLSGEAALNAIAITTAAKYAFGRERPGEGSGRGQFFDGGVSFPSEHASLTWSIASVLAHEYPGWGTKLFAYGTATAVSFGRVYGRKHFPSDVLVGSALGWLVGREIYRKHHDPELEGSAIGTFVDPKNDNLRELSDYGSSYVPVDSWVYPAIDRLAALGYIATAYSGIKPWTRAECARLVAEAGDVLERGYADYEPVMRTYDSLKEEFSVELAGLTGEIAPAAQVESLYARTLGISGSPLNDSYHFGQTITKDYGRPYAGGVNQIAGFSARAAAGPVAFYFRGEYQHAPALDRYSDEVLTVLAAKDFTPIVGVPANVNFDSADRFRMIEGYAALNFKSIQVSAGKQDLSWGPGEGSPLLFSNNAEPMYMLRITKTSPWRIPVLSWVLGPAQWDFFFGRLEEHLYPPKPYLHGQKVTFRPTRNLELGFSRTVMFAGEGRPLTLGTFWKSFVSVGDTATNVPGSTEDVGDRRGGFDFTYRVPWLRDKVQLYGDFMSEDDPSPIAAPRRAMWRPGIYFSNLPGLPKWDLRIEGPHSAAGAVAEREGFFFYVNASFRNGYTNKGQILGSWIGRRATGIEAWSTYWITGESKLRAHFRRMQVDEKFIPEGARLTEVSLMGDAKLNRRTTLSATIGYVNYVAPLLSSTTERNFVGAIQLTYRPAWQLKGGDPD